MSSTRNTKRKRSKAAVAPATSSTRERAEEAEIAQTITGDSTAGVGKKTADTSPSSRLITTTSAKLDNENGESKDSKTSDGTFTEEKVLDSQSSNESTKKRGINSESNATEPISKTNGNGKSTGTDKMVNTKQNQPSASGSTLMSVDASSSSTSSQDGTSTRRQALHISNDDEDREKRMRDLISHRSVLLERVRACRASAENRVGNKSAGDNKNKMNSNDLSDEQEIAAFRSMTKAANQAARKSRELEAGGEKRTSLSLRRGSSVGKRMNAALSSLVPGSNTTGTTGSGANNPSVGQSTTAAAGKATNNNPNSADSKSETKGASPYSKYSTIKSAGRLPTNHLSNDSSITMNTMKSNLNSKSNKSLSPLSSQAIKQNDASSRGRPSNSKNSKNSKAGGVQTATGVSHSLTSSQNLKKNAVLPIGARSASIISAAAASSSILAKKGPKIDFPEAIALREKREQIESKLRDLMERKQSNASLTPSVITGSGKIISSSSYEEEINRRKVVSGGAGNAKAISNKKPIHPVMKSSTKSEDNGLDILPPAPLPNRRRTHWDVVLQEMTWLASDFMEERKWKLSTSRLISSKIPVPGLSDRRKRTSEANRGGSDSMPRDLPADANNNVNDDSSGNDPANGESDGISKKRDGRRKYSVPVPDDEEIAKCRSQILSCMISELESAIKKGGSLENSDKHHQEALIRFLTSRSDIICSTNDQVMNDFGDKNDETDDSQIDGSADEMNEDNSTHDGSKFDSIDDYIDHFHSLCNSKHKLAVKETAKALKGGKVKLTAKQKEMLEFVDKLWSGKPHTGAVIFGSSISGMTFGTSTIIWKQRRKGSQILICPSRSLIRWKYELSRFSDMRVLTFGSTGGISNPDGDNSVAKVGSTDVILCEYSSVSRMKNALSKKSENPFSVIVDLRHFASLRRSLSASTGVSSEDFPSELLSNSWWGDIVALVRKREIRCLFLEYYDSDPLSLSSSDLGQKEQISILAKRAACVIGPEVFGSGSHSIERKVITWARRKGKSDIVDKALRVRRVLEDTLKPMSFRITKPIVSSFDMKWELRSCSMSADQREEYERCCNELRGALSSSIKVSNPNRCHYSVPAVSNALFQLRQECSYSRKYVIQPCSPSHNESPPLTPKTGSGLSVSKHIIPNIWANSSQPDADRATSILESSSKLKELISILISEVGYVPKVDEFTKKMLNISKGAKKGKDQKRSVKKIVIFATLPNFQNLLSTLLNALGIQNELLCRSKGVTENRNSCGEMKSPHSDKHTQKFEAIAWTKSQNILSRFCGDNHDRKTNIIITSPAVLSGRNDGIGIEGADMIIALDSDWSGRDGFIVNFLIRRWHTKNKLAGKEDRLIRLVTANSVEEKIFDGNDFDSDVLSWPLDSDGFFTLPISQDEASAMYDKFTEDNQSSNSSFPAVGIMQNRGHSLEDVLSASHLPSFFGSGKPSLFLPRRLNKASSDQETIAEVQFLQYFLDKEKFGSASTWSTTPTSKSQIYCPGLTSRNDMAVIDSRLFLEKLIHSYSLSKDIDDQSSAHGVHSNVLLRNVTQAPGESSSLKIDENPSSLLFYEPYQDLSSESKGSLTKSTQSELVENKVENKTKRRYNAFAKLFSSSWNGISLRDGNQGCEPLVFFPPLFPLLEEVSKKARIKYISSAKVIGDIRGIVKSTYKNEVSSAQKRKDRDFTSTLNDGENDAKRPRTQSASHHDARNGYSGPVSSLGNDITELSSKSPSTSKERVIAQNGKAQTDSASSTEGSKVNKSSGVIMEEEDFGLLGSGAFPSHIDATSFSAHDAKVNGSYRPVHGSNIVPCDVEESNTCAMKHMDEGMQSVLLFVKKRPRSTQAPYKHNQASSNKLPLPIGSKAIGDDSVKKIKKRGAQGTSQLPPTAFTRLPGNSGTQNSQIIPRTSMANSRQVKGDFRHKLLASFYARQRSTGLTIFDSVPYRVAATRVEKRVMDRVEKIIWKSSLALDAGPGLPIKFVEKSLLADKSPVDRRQGLDSIVDELKDGLSTGVAAITQSRVQRLEFKSSSVSPRCVDFGAFEVGYLSSPSGMTGLPTTRCRVGVSLPMGVRLMKPTKEQEKRSSWNVGDDRILQETAKKFGMNWLLIASATSGFEHAVIKYNLPGIENITPSVAKSARQCRHRWQILNQSEQSLSNKKRFQKSALVTSDGVHKSEKSDTKDKASVYSAENINIFCKSEIFMNLSETKDLASNTDMRDVVKDEKNDDASSEHTLMRGADASSSVAEGIQIPDAQTTKSKRRSFSAISIARSRRQIFPVTIPGVDVGANQPGHPVPSHPSHMQSVQMSVAAQWASGRTEMWPLQILDLADKQRSNAARINNMQRGEISAVHNPSRRHPTASSSYQHRPQASQASAVRAPVGYSTGMNASSRSVAPRPVNPSVAPHHQHRSPPVAASTVQAYLPPQNSTTGNAKKAEKQKPSNKSSPKKG